MTKEASTRIGLLQGTLDMPILRTPLCGPAHGHQIAKHLQRTTDDVLQVKHGSLYPALHRLRLTPAGRKHLAREESKWKQLAAAIAQVMWPAKEG